MRPQLRKFLVRIADLSRKLAGRQKKHKGLFQFILSVKVHMKRCFNLQTPLLATIFFLSLEEAGGPNEQGE